MEENLGFKGEGESGKGKGGKGDGGKGDRATFDLRGLGTFSFPKRKKCFRVETTKTKIIL